MTHSTRVRLPSAIPEWKGSAYEKYARAWVVRNGWRVRYLIGDDEDQMQECAFIFYKLRQRYYTVNPKWFMALFKTSLFNKWATWAKKDWPLRQMEDYALALDNEECAELVQELVTPKALEYLNRKQGKTRHNQTPEWFEPPPVLPEAEVVSSFHFFSSELRAVLQMVADAPRDLLEFLFTADYTQQVLETRLCRMAKQKHKPVLTELQEALR